MNEDEFRVWMEAKGMDRGGISSRLSSVRRVELVLDDLDVLALSKTREEFLEPFTYSSEDKRLKRSNPSPLSFAEGADLYNGLSSIRTALGHYHDFIQEGGETKKWKLPDDVKKLHTSFIDQLTLKEIQQAKLECDQSGTETFLASRLFSRPVVWMRSAGNPTNYPAKAIVCAAVSYLPDCPKLDSKTFFNGYGEAQSNAVLTRLGFNIVKRPTDETPSVSIDRAQIEAAMDAYDSYRTNGAHGHVFDVFGEPRDYCVRSSRERENRVYPTKPLIGFILNKTELNGGWGQKADAAARLHNAGFIIVNQNDEPVERPERYEHLMEGADRIRLCALNYFIEPAREKAARDVSIRAGDLASAMGLKDAFPSICQALGGEKFQKLAQVPSPKSTEPNPSSSTIFTYKLNSQAEADAVTDTTKAPAPSAVNLILYGPPGTGKTYRTAWEAVRLCLGEQIASGLKGSAQRAALMSTYRKLVSEGRVEFVTFHQSMSYEEFVEGLRPETVRDETSDSTTDPSATGGFRLRVEDGVFKRIARRADASRGQNSTGERLSLEGRNVFKMSIGAVAIPEDAGIFDEAITENCAIFGFFRSDFSGDEFTERHAIKAQVEQDYTDEDLGFSLTSAVQMTDIFRNNLQQGDVVLVSKGNLLIRAIGMVEGDYEFQPREGSETYPHRRAMRWLWVDEAGMPANEFYDMAISQRTIYPLRKKELNIALVERYMNSQSINQPVSPEPHVLIIDEINRANISKVFGELITLLEPDKRLGMDNEIRLTLPYSKKSFGVPQNLHVIGTMNTADRSIALLDTALRRRFAFRELMPNPSVLSNNVEGVDLQKLLSTINERIEYLFDREHQIGHAYFTGCQTQAEIDSAMRDKVIPLLAEYFYEDWSKVAAVLGDSGQGPSRFLVAKQIAAPAGMTEDDFSGDKLRWTVKDRFDFSEFAA
jgi:5-methylcytosine-specific restriction protein B